MAVAAQSCQTLAILIEITKNSANFQFQARTFFRPFCVSKICVCCWLAGWLFGSVVVHFVRSVCTFVAPQRNIKSEYKTFNYFKKWFDRMIYEWNFQKLFEGE